MTFYFHNFLTGRLVDGNSDFAAAAFSQSKARSMVVDYISLNLEEYQQIFIRNPAELYHWEVYSLPLTKNAWFGALVFLFITPFLMSVATMEGNEYSCYIPQCIFVLVYTYGAPGHVVSKIIRRHTFENGPSSISVDTS